MTDEQPRSDASVSAELPDWTREHPQRFWDPPRQLLKSIRNYQKARLQDRPWSGLVRKWCVVRHWFWTLVTGAEVHLGTKIGGGLMLPHPNGIVIHPEATIGPNCTIFQQVTIGTTRKGGFPRIGGQVDIGAGARILGDVVIGDHAVIGANAVVITDVPPHGRAVGVPAVVSPRSGLAKAADVKTGDEDG